MYEDNPQYKHFKKEKNSSTGKWGIRNISTNRLVVQYVFDDIVWYEYEGLVVFRLNGKEAVYNASHLEGL